MGPATASIRPFERAYVNGLLALQHKTLAEMKQHQILPYSHTHSADLLAGDPQPHRSGLARRLQQAPEGGILAVDLLTVKHEGASIEGVGRVYSSTDNGVVWGHALVSSALVFADQDPYPLQLAPLPTEPMATETYPRLTATEGMLNVVGDVIEAGYDAKAKAKGTGWECFALLSSVRGGLQEVLHIWRLRWDLEWSHRLYKQNLGLGSANAGGSRVNSSMLTWCWMRFWRCVLNEPSRPHCLGGGLKSGWLW